MAPHKAFKGEHMGVAMERSENGSMAHIEPAKDVESLLRDLLDRYDELDPYSTNADRVLDSDLIAFLSSERGEEFSDALRALSFQRYSELDRQATELRAELVALERRLNRESRVFIFVESAISRCQAQSWSGWTPNQQVAAGRPPR
jgi:hypothetical protein